MDNDELLDILIYNLYERLEYNRVQYNASLLDDSPDLFALGAYNEALGTLKVLYSLKKGVTPSDLLH